MTNSGSTGIVKAMAVIAAFAACSSAEQAISGETSVYLKSGWFTWDEKVDGRSFISEEGMMYGAGLTREDDVQAVTLSERFEVWGGNPDYDGHNLTNTAVISSDTSYLGTREEVAVSVKLPAAQAVSIDPSVGLGHKFWIRTRSNEDWNTFYVKAGAGLSYKKSAYTLFARGGALLPLYTRTHATLSDAGYSDVVTEPETRVSAYAEGGVRAGAFTVSVEYEGMEFGKSKKVTTSRIASTGSGVVIIQNQAYQPESSSSLVSLRVSYSF